MIDYLVQACLWFVGGPNVHQLWCLTTCLHDYLLCMGMSMCCRWPKYTSTMVLYNLYSSCFMRHWHAYMTKVVQVYMNYTNLQPLLWLSTWSRPDFVLYIAHMHTFDLHGPDLSGWLHWPKHTQLTLVYKTVQFWSAVELDCQPGAVC